MKQLQAISPETDHYRTLLDELQSKDSYEGLKRLDADIGTASQACSNFKSLIDEKSNLPPSLEEANRTILDKLAEIRAVAGLHRLDFEEIRFGDTPDLRAKFNGSLAAIEVTRLGHSVGRRSWVWDEQGGDLDHHGFRWGTMSSSGNVERAISDAIYREMEGKHLQLRDADAKMTVLWLSLGRDYYAAEAYELNGISVFARMDATRASTAASAIKSVRLAKVCQRLTHLVICYGRDETDSLLEVSANR